MFYFVFSLVAVNHRGYQQVYFIFGALVHTHHAREPFRRLVEDAVHCREPMLPYIVPPLVAELL